MFVGFAGALASLVATLARDAADREELSTAWTWPGGGDFRVGLGSNLTIAGAPALYVAANICEREENRKVSLREFLRWSVPFTLISCTICYVFGMLIWVLPYAN